MSAVQVNYPSTTIRLEDPSANYSEISPFSVKVNKGSGSNYNTLLTGDALTLEGVAPNRKTYITPMSVQLQNNTDQVVLSVSDGLLIYAGDGINYTYLTQHQLRHRGNVPFDMSFNSLSLKGVTSNHSGMVITSDASGAPYWADPSFNGTATNHDNVVVKLCGNQENYQITTTPYAIPVYNLLNINTFFNFSEDSSVINLNTNIVTGYTIIMRNNTASSITINTTPTALIYATGSGSALSSYSIPSYKTITIKTIYNYGYYITCEY